MVARTRVAPTGRHPHRPTCWSTTWPVPGAAARRRAFAAVSVRARRARRRGGGHVDGPLDHRGGRPGRPPAPRPAVRGFPGRRTGRERERRGVRGHRSDRPGPVVRAGPGEADAGLGHRRAAGRPGLLELPGHGHPRPHRGPGHGPGDRQFLRRPVRRRPLGQAALHELGVDEAQLPVVGRMGQGLGTVPDTPTAFAGGSIDAFCEQIVAGANRPGDVLAIFGATLIVWVVAEEWRDVPGLTTLPNIDGRAGDDRGPEQRRGPASPTGRAPLSGARCGAGRRPTARTPPETARVGDPDRVPVWLPYLRGERTPFHDPRLRASVHGLDIAQGPDAAGPRRRMRRAGSSSGASSSAPGSRARRIVATGGGSRVGAVDAGGGRCHRTAGGHGGGVRGRGTRGGLPGPDGRRPRVLVRCRRWLGAWPARRIDPDPAWAAAASGRFEQFEALGPAG